MSIFGMIFFIIAIVIFIYSGKFIKDWLINQRKPGFLRTGGAFLIGFFVLTLSFTGLSSNDKASDNKESSDTEAVEDSSFKESSEKEANKSDSEKAKESSDREQDEELERIMVEAKDAHIKNYKKSLTKLPETTKGAITSASYDNETTTVNLTNASNFMNENDLKASAKGAYDGTYNLASEYDPYPENDTPRYVEVKNGAGKTVAKSSAFMGSFKFIGN